MIDGENTKQAASRSRMVIHATCTMHGDGAGFANVVVSKREGTIELDLHADGSCVLTLAEDEAVAFARCAGEVAQVSAQHGDGQAEAPSELHCIHLLAAERELLAECHRYGVYLAVCGEVLPVAELASSHCGGECDLEVTYCQDCLRDAVRRNADAGLAWSLPGTRLLIDSSVHHDGNGR